MFAFKSIAVALAIAPFALAQDNAIALKAIQAHFTQSALVPDLLASFDPSALLSLNFPGMALMLNTILI